MPHLLLLFIHLYSRYFATLSPHPQSGGLLIGTCRWFISQIQVGRSEGHCTEYSRGIEGKYLSNRMHGLRTKWERGNVDQQFEEAIGELCPEYPDGP